MKLHIRIINISICIILSMIAAGDNESFASEKVDALLQQFDQADRNKQIYLAQDFFRQLEKEKFLEAPFAISSRWPVDSIRAEVWSNAGQYYFYDQDFRRSIYYSDLALPLLQGGKDTDKLADCMSYLSVAYTRLSDYANAINASSG